MSLTSGVIKTRKSECHNRRVTCAQEDFSIQFYFVSHSSGLNGPVCVCLVEVSRPAGGRL